MHPYVYTQIFYLGVYASHFYSQLFPFNTAQNSFQIHTYASISSVYGCIIYHCMNSNEYFKASFAIINNAVCLHYNESVCKTDFQKQNYSWAEMCVCILFDRFYKTLKLLHQGALSPPQHLKEHRDV